MQNDEGTIFHSIIALMIGLILLTVMMSLVGSMLNSISPQDSAFSPTWNKTIQNVQSTTNIGFSVLLLGLILLVAGVLIVVFLSVIGGVPTSERQVESANVLNERFDTDPRLRVYGAYGSNGVQGSSGTQGGMPSPAYSGYAATQPLQQATKVSQDKTINRIPDKTVITNTTNRWETLDVVIESDFE